MIYWAGVSQSEQYDLMTEAYRYSVIFRADK
jgi:hypothetical protein